MSEQENKTPEVAKQVIESERNIDVKAISAERDAAAALVGEEEGGETSEAKIKFSEVKWMQVDDNEAMHSTTGNALAGEGLEKAVAKARSVEGALNAIKKIVAEKTKLNAILLDKDFYLYEDEEVTDDRNAEEFLRSLTTYLSADKEAAEHLKDLKIILLSSHAGDLKVMAELRAISDKLVGGIDKSELPILPQKMKEILTKTGIVEG